MFFVVTLIAIAFLCKSNGFATSHKSPATKATIKMIAENFPGQTAPFGFFDPIGFSNAVDEKNLKLWREAEIKHGRIAMLSAVGILVSEKWNPLFGGQISGPSIYHFQQIENIFSPFGYLLSGTIALAELYNIQKGWETQEEKTSNIAMLKESYIPGDLGFDPLGLAPSGRENADNLSPEFVDISNKELNNGRLAMIGVAGMVAQELVDKNTILGHIADHGFAFAKYGASTNTLGAF